MGPELTANGGYDVYVAKLTAFDLVFADNFVRGDTAAWTVTASGYSLCAASIDAIVSKSALTWVVITSTPPSYGNGRVKARGSRGGGAPGGCPPAVRG